MSTPAPRKLVFRSTGDVIEEVERLRDGGYTPLGQWSLEQMCFHLGCPIPQPLKALPSDPAPEQKPDVIARFQHYVDHGHPPAGATAPPASEPPATVPADAVDDLFVRLRSIDSFDGAFVDFGPRGAIPVGLYRPFILAHCAHHLSLLIPRQPR